jgi:hypothetical protein
VDLSSNGITSPTGTKVSNPTFFYKDNLEITWYVTTQGTVVNLSGATFTLKIAGAYNGLPLLTVTNGDFTAIDLVNGEFSCLVDLNQAAILSFIDLEDTKTGYVSLWSTIGGVDYLLANFKVAINNIIF